MSTTTTTTVLRPFLHDYPGEPVPEENFWTLWCKGRLMEADTLTVRLGATPSGLTTTDSTIRVSRLPVLDCGMTFHPGFGGRDSPSILSDDF